MCKFNNKLIVLIIEDDDADYEYIKTMLPAGAVVNRAVSIKTFDQLPHQYYDIIVCDLGLPDAVGERVLTHVRKVIKHTGIIVCTGAFNVHEYHRCVEAGATSYFVKNNITKEKFSRSIDTVISLSNISRNIERSELALNPLRQSCLA